MNLDGKRYIQAESKAIHTELQALSLEQLDAKFRHGEVPLFEEIEGHTAGAWLAKSPNSYWWAESFIKVFLNSPWARWTGKGFFTPFDHDRRGKGGNLFNNHFGRVRYRLATYIKKAEVDENKVLVLRYPKFSLMYGLIDDVRKIDDGVFLGQMHYRFPWQKSRIFIGYFVLCSLRKSDNIFQQ